MGNRIKIPTVGLDGAKPHVTAFTQESAFARTAVGLLAIIGLAFTPAIAATTAPATPPATHPADQPLLPRVSVHGGGLDGYIDLTVTSDGVYAYAYHEFPDKIESATFQLDRQQIAGLAKAIQQTLDRPSNPQKVTDYFVKITIGGQTWESNDIDDKFTPLHEALNRLQRHK